MANQIVAGRVNIDGSIAGGSGFYVRALGGGITIIEFDHPLPEVPTVVLKENYKNWSDFDFAGGDTRDNVVLVAVDEKGFKVITGGSSGTKEDRNFAFIAAVRSTQDSNQAIVWGDISADATTYSGTGFEATGIGDGVYLVAFDQPLKSLSSVVLTQSYQNWNDFSYTGGNTLDNAVIVAAKGSEFKYITGGSSGAKIDRNCSFVAVGERDGAAIPLRLAFGNVNANGTVRNGSGDFSVKKEATGTYTISFSGAFAKVPAMLLTQNYKDWTDFKFASGDTRDNAVLVAIDISHARVITGQDNGSKADRNFGFLVVG